ncbi:MAG TPA: hypothetical protein VMT71_00485 [Syntrophorhabdales bacterium]|nr:hypothetical protein [Syntrophorhabdales bacterium]
MKKASKSSITGFCDLMCKYAELPKDGALDGSGSCRTFIAVYCNRRKTFVPKNLACSQKQMRQ